ncbi:hypothetical protein F383_31261 [Gossypium arboreum]|nr:hypothetical protein F383_31261 [Gossypium arboreum]
MSMRHYMCRLL